MKLVRLYVKNLKTESHKELLVNECATGKVRSDVCTLSFSRRVIDGGRHRKQFWPKVKI
jgi:hypothetical protein